MFLPRKLHNISQKGFSPVYLFLVIGLLAVGLFVFLNQRQAQQTKPSQQPLTKVKYATSLGAAQEIRSFFIKKNGIDKKHGLDIEYTYLNPGDVERVLFSGEFPVGAPSTLSVITTNLKGASFKIFGPELHMTYQIIVPKDSPIKSLADLKGKKFGTLPKITAAYSATAVVLKSKGLDPEQDLQLVFGNISQVVDFLKSGAADAAIVSYPSGAKLFADGKYRSIAKLEDVWKESENGLPLPFVVTAASKDWLENNKETARRLIAVHLEASQLIQKDPSVILTLTDYLKKDGYETDAVKQLLIDNTPELMYEKWDDQDIQGLKRLIQRAKENNIIPADSPGADQILVYPL